MKALLVTALVALLALLYLNTAVVKGEGGGGSVLVFRPFHGLSPFYGGGEEGSWRRDHPDQPDPWWQTGAFTRLASFEDEATTSPVVLSYYLGYYATLLGLLGLVIYYPSRRALLKASSVQP